MGTVPRGSPRLSRIDVWLKSDDEDHAEPAYRGEVVAADGWLDLAVVRVVSDADGAPLPGPLDLPTVDIGDGTELRSGSSVYVVGYPGISGREAQRITPGSVAAYLEEDRLDDGRRDIIDTTAQIAPGNSGVPPSTVTVASSEFR